MSPLQPVRGARDILPENILTHRHVEETLCRVATCYGYSEIVTPVFEFTEVFARTLGDTSDVVTKEMYTFLDKGGDSLTLRPENTAGVARAFISGGMAQKLPLKLFYRGPMFRYERPQKGRQRQFHQVGVELLGVEGPAADVEVIALGAQYLEWLGVLDKATLELNTLGDAESRAAYRTKLVEYYQGQREKLSEDSLGRLERNPLRILDSKDEGDKAVNAGAPLIDESLNDASRRFFDQVQAGLDTVGVSYTLNSHMVRGLDYYCHTAFEFVTGALGAQGALLAGGRYDGLIKQLGGPSTPGTGWAAGVERLAMLDATAPAAPRPIAMVPAGNSDGISRRVLTLTQALRGAGFRVDLGYSGNVGKRMKRANKINACAVVIVGEDELERRAATVRDMDSGEQTEVPLDSLQSHLARYR